MKIILACGCEFTGKRPNFADPGLLAVAFWCPNGHKGLQHWTFKTEAEATSV